MRNGRARIRGREGGREGGRQREGGGQSLGLTPEIGAAMTRSSSTREIGGEICSAVKDLPNTKKPPPLSQYFPSPLLSSPLPAHLLPYHDRLP
eukprot:761307-Hanusia_phi.AAC.3